MTLDDYLSFLNSDSFKKALYDVLSTTEKIVLVPRKPPTPPISNCTITLTKQPVFNGEWFEMYFDIFIFDKKIEVYKSNQTQDDFDVEKPKIPVFSIPAKDIELFVENLDNIRDYVKNVILEYNKAMVKRYVTYRRNCNKKVKQILQMKKQISETA